MFCCLLIYSKSFKNICSQYYELDSCHYFSSPGLIWDAMRQLTSVKLDLTTGFEMNEFIEKGMRGGVSYIAQTYSNANNKYMQSYNKVKII